MGTGCFCFLVLFRCCSCDLTPQLSTGLACRESGFCVPVLRTREQSAGETSYRYPLRRAFFPVELSAGSLRKDQDQFSNLPR